MSLLMEALKKAEEAKRKAADSSEALPSSKIPPLTLAPDTPSPATKPTNSSPLPDLSLHIASVDADLAAVSTEVPPRRRAGAAAAKGGGARTEPRASERDERAAIQNVFAAKRTDEPRNGLWILVAIGGAAVLAIAAYFWWQLNSLSNAGSLRSTPPQPPAPAIAMPAQQASPAEIQRAAPPTLAATPIAQSTGRETPAYLPPSAAPQAESRPSDAAASAPPTKGQSAAARARTTSAPAVEESPVRLSRTEPATNPTLERAYDDLQAGHLDQAQRGYELVLRRDPRSTDALLGLATIAGRLGQRDRARSFYEQALESDPTDATAQAGLLNTGGQSDPAMSESRLKLALASQPNSPAVLFALGNLYAREARWSEAQQAYFRAYGSAPDNADFIYNLAVSLDHLRQAQLAAQYYRMALEAPNADRALFDRNHVQRRILELQP